MDEKISLEAIALYGDAYADKVLKEFFASKEKITGQEILSLCNVQQVNLFIVRELFKSWREETKKLKSAYFDYENEEVKESLENLMRVLSQNISIDQAHFAPLLKKAVSQALLAVFDPYDFFAMILAGKNNKLEVAPFREEIKYLKINKAPLERMLQKLEERDVKEISGNEAFAILDQILEEVNFNPDDVEEYLEKFSAVVPLDANKFYVSKMQAPEFTAPSTTPKPAPTLPPPPGQPLITPLVKEEAPKAPEPPKSAPQPPKPAPEARPQAPQPSLNESIKQQPRTAVIDNFQKIGKIKDSLTINQKFMFTKVLFHGDFELFSRAIDQLDRYDNIKAAMRYIEEEHATGWDHDSEEFHEFMELVERRFL
jgi:hypothetical protein